MTADSRLDRRGLSRSRPVYARALRLRHVDPSDLLCFVFLEGMVAFAAVLGLAELVTWWAVLILPATVAVMVKINDLLAGALAAGRHQAGTGPAGSAGQSVPASRSGLASRTGLVARRAVQRVGRDRNGTLYRVEPPWRRLRGTVVTSVRQH